MKVRCVQQVEGIQEGKLAKNSNKDAIKEIGNDEKVESL